jgi:molybdenum cofactor biosynthesis protein B
MASDSATPQPLGLAILTVSDTRSAAEDRSGDTAEALARAAGHEVVARGLVRDELLDIRAALADYIARAAVDVVITTGGTGLTPRDVTPEALAPLVTKPIPGFGELFRWLSYEEIGTTAMQSRAEAGLCATTLVFLLPGSPSAVRMAMTRLVLPQLDVRHRPSSFAALLPRIRSESPHEP